MLKTTIYIEYDEISFREVYLHNMEEPFAIRTFNLRHSLSKENFVSDADRCTFPLLSEAYLAIVCLAV